MKNRIAELTKDLTTTTLQVRSLKAQKTELQEALDEYRNLYHMAEAKVLSRDALLEQLSENQLAQDVAKAEVINAELLEACRYALESADSSDVRDKLSKAIRKAGKRNGGGVLYYGG